MAEKKVPEFLVYRNWKQSFQSIFAFSLLIIAHAALAISLRYFLLSNNYKFDFPTGINIHIYFTIVFLLFALFNSKSLFRSYSSKDIVRVMGLSESDAIKPQQYFTRMGLYRFRKIFKWSIFYLAGFIVLLTSIYTWVEKGDPLGGSFWGLFASVLFIAFCIRYLVFGIMQTSVYLEIYPAGVIIRYGFYTYYLHWRKIENVTLVNTAVMQSKKQKIFKYKPTQIRFDVMDSPHIARLKLEDMGKQNPEIIKKIISLCNDYGITCQTIDEMEDLRGRRFGIEVTTDAERYRSYRDTWESKL